MAMKKLTKQKQTFVLENTNGMHEIFADGISNLLLGKNVSKVVFHTDSMSDSDDTNMHRKAILTLIMSTPSLILTCINILEAAKESSEKLTSKNDSQIKIQEMLDRISFTEK